MFRRIFAAAVFSLLGAAASAAELQPFALQFDVARNGKALGEASLSLTRGSDESWIFRTHTIGTSGMASLAGVDIDERSEFRYVDGRPETIGYRFQQKMRFKSRQRSFTVSPAAKRIDGRDDDGSFSIPYEPGLLDRNLVVLALAGDVESAAGSLDYRIADKRKVDVHTYRIAGRETLETARGRLETVRVERVRSSPGRQTTTWIAPSLGYLPVRIRQIEPDGETLDMTLR